jgi:sentrin-specific protease 7
MIQKKNCHPKARYMTVQSRDLESLQPGKYVNNVIIDFWSAWIMRKEVQTESVVLPMMTYFYTTLSSVGGVEQVLRWTQKLDIFSKRFIFVPVNEALHWSQCVVINPGLITAFNDDEVDVEVPCLIILDSLQCHSRKEIAQNLRTWLNAELNRVNNVNDNLFTPLTMSCFSPIGLFSMSLLIITTVYVSLLNLKTSSFFY